MIKEMSTKALPDFDWGQEWIKPDGNLSVIVVVHEPFATLPYFHKTFPKPNALHSDITIYENERTIGPSTQQRLSKWLKANPNKLHIITSHHAFIFNLVHDLDFRPDMFYIYNESKGFQRLPDCTPRALRKAHNYAKMYIAGAFDTECDNE